MVWLWIVGGVILGLALTLFGIYKYTTGNQDFWRNQGVFSVRPNELYPFWTRIRFKVPFHLLELKLYRKFKDGRAGMIAGQLMFRHPVLYILDLDLVRNVLVKDFDHFVNRRVFEVNDSSFSQMLLNKVDQDWKDLRGTMSPTFTTGKIKQMFGIFNESSLKMVKYLKEEIEKSSEIEIRDACGKFTMDVIAGAAFGIDSQTFVSDEAPFAINAKKMQDNFTPKLIFKFMLAIMIPRLAKYLGLSFIAREPLEFLEGVVKESIRRRREGGEKRNDFLQLMIEAQNDQLQAEENEEALETFEKDAQFQNGGRKAVLTDEILIAQCNLFFFAGFDTTETLLIFAAYELARDPEVQERLFQELNEAVSTKGGELEYDMISQFKYLDMVVSETLRIYAPAIRLERKCNKDYKIPDSDFVIKKDTHVAVPTYGIHHDPELYPDPERFDPERFTAENKAARHPYAYMPFGLGPRNCIAMRFALMEGKAAVAHLVLNFRLSPCSKTDIPMKFNTKGLLKPLNGMWLNLESRASSIG